MRCGPIAGYQQDVRAGWGGVDDTMKPTCSARFISSVNPLMQRSPTLVAPGTGFVEDNFPRTRGGEVGWFRDDHVLDSHKERAT